MKDVEIYKVIENTISGGYIITKGDLFVCRFLPNDYLDSSKCKLYAYRVCEILNNANH